MSGESRSSLMKKIKQWLCSMNIHWIKIVKVLRGGSGPDYATHIVKCAWCQKKGYRYLFDGRWSNDLK